MPKKKYTVEELEARDHKQIATKYFNKLDEMFALYCMGYTLKKISDITGVPFFSVREMVYRNNWKKKKELLNLDVANEEGHQIVKAKNDAIKLSMLMLRKVGVDLLKKVQNGELDVTIRDFNSCVKNFMLLTQDLNLNTLDQPSNADNFIMDEIAEELSPEQRGVLLEIRDIIKKKKLQKSLEEKTQDVEEDV